MRHATGPPFSPSRDAPKRLALPGRTASGFPDYRPSAATDSRNKEPGVNSNVFTLTNSVLRLMNYLTIASGKGTREGASSHKDDAGRTTLSLRLSSSLVPVSPLCPILKGFRYWHPLSLMPTG